MRISACILAAALAANLSLPCGLPCDVPAEEAPAPFTIVWENGVTPDLPAVEADKPAEEEKSAAPAEEAPAAPVISDEAAQVAALVNMEREKAGLSALAYDAKLCEAAKIRAQEIVRDFAHERPDGSSCFTVLRDLHISYVACGENIAKGSQTPEAVMNGWMNSAGHRANILNAHFTKIGVAMVKVGNTRYWVQCFIA